MVGWRYQQNPRPATAKTERIVCDPPRVCAVSCPCIAIYSTCRCSHTKADQR